MKSGTSSLLVLAVLLTVSSVVLASGNERVLKSKKGKSKKGKSKDKEPMYADIESLIDDDDDMSDIHGWVSLEYDDDDMFMDYHIMDGPKRCDTCKLAIYSGKSCDKLYDPHYDTDEDPWSADDTPYITNSRRRAAGFMKIDNGYDYKDNECKFVVLFDEDDDDRRMLSSGSSDGKRALKSKKSKKKGKPKKIACGQLIPEDENNDYCD